MFFCCYLHHFERTDAEFIVIYNTFFFLAKSTFDSIRMLCEPFRGSQSYGLEHGRSGPHGFCNGFGGAVFGLHVNYNGFEHGREGTRVNYNDLGQNNGPQVQFQRNYRCSGGARGSPHRKLP